MKHFTFRLFLIRKLIESLMWSCIDEYTEFEEIADGLGKAHSAMEKRRNPAPKPMPVESEQAECISLIAKHRNCHTACHEWLKSHKGIFCEACKMEVSRGTRPDYWSCNDEQKSAKRWLAEHGIKE